MGTGEGQCAGSLRKIGSLLLCRSWGLSSVYQVWWQASYSQIYVANINSFLKKDKVVRNLETEMPVSAFQNQLGRIHLDL